ncbi:recombinase family protein [Shewanella baltica]|nr:recombinase family protein [Shewanella baltica]
MYIFGYLRASTSDQNAKRAQSTLQQFVQDKGFRIAGWYIENESGASLQRPEFLRLLDDAAKGDAIIIEQIDRLSRLDEKSWFTLKEMLYEKELKVISLDLPTSHIALFPQITDQNGRHFSANLGLVPKEFSSGGKQKLGGITKRGNSYLRRQLIQGAWSVIRYATNNDDRLSVWARNIIERRGKQKAAVAVANKLARIIWAMLYYKTEYRAC